jgi:hypothetical protein
MRIVRRLSIQFILLAMAFAFTACSGGGGGGFKVKNPDAIIGKVKPQKISTQMSSGYSGISNNWNTFIKDDGSDVFHATGVECNPTSDTACFHAGEIFGVELPSNVSSCSGVTINDNLGAFNWKCVSKSGKFYAFSTGLKKAKGLITLIDGTSFKENYIEVYNSSGSKVAYTDPAVWWSNPIVDLSVVLGASAGNVQIESGTYAEGTVFVVSSNLKRRWNLFRG